MPDISQDVIYTLGNYNFNAVTVAPKGVLAQISGSKLDSIEMSDVDVQQFLEKRAQQDGMDAGDPFLGARRVRFAATLYGGTRALFYDALRDLRAAMSPVLAARYSPADKGYLPLYFSEPTNRIAEFPGQMIDLMVRAMPHTLSYVEQDSMMGGPDSAGLAIPYQGVFICKDPAILGAQPVDLPFAPTDNASGTWHGRGNYLSSLNALFVVSSAGGTITGTVGGKSFVITIPASSGDRIIRYKGADKIITVEESGIEAVDMSLVAFNGLDTWPLIPQGVDVDYSFEFSDGLTLVGSAGDSHAWFWEQYA